MSRPIRFPAPAPLDPENRREILLFTNHEPPWRHTPGALKLKADAHCRANGLRQLSASDSTSRIGDALVMVRTVVVAKIGDRS